MLQITYLHHSGFAAQTDDALYFFDVTTKIPQELLEVRKPVFFIVSHGHHDHYDPEIFSYRDTFREVHYIVSDDIRLFPNRDLLMTRPGERFVLRGADEAQIVARTFGSTDLGISILISESDCRLFFSGDLNWWAWDTKKRPHLVPEVEERDYKREIEKLSRTLSEPLTCAFVPVDPRLDDGTLKAAEYFIDTLHPQYLIPMHFWDDFSVIDRLRQARADSSTIIPAFTHDDEIVVDLK